MLYILMKQNIYFYKYLKKITLLNQLKTLSHPIHRTTAPTAPTVSDQLLSAAISYYHGDHGLLLARLASPLATLRSNHEHLYIGGNYATLVRSSAGINGRVVPVLY
jgi:hypothetical protein